LSRSESSENYPLNKEKTHYIEGQNIRIEYRNSAGDVGRIPRNAQELVGLPVDIIVTAGPNDTRAAKLATRTIPIVMSQDNDPVGNGFVASLARPGANITGLSTLSADLSGKRLELLKEILPRVSRIAVIGTSNTPGNATALKQTQTTGAALGVSVQFYDVLNVSRFVNFVCFVVKQSRSLNTPRARRLRSESSLTIIRKFLGTL
jgi:putative ABC transport system substrate-binding protein